MIKNNLYTGNEAQERLISGIRKCASAVGGTMGTSGHNALIEAIESPGHLTTNDGATISKMN
jgi:chaperonin GroEL (HSP60 family)